MGLHILDIAGAVVQRVVPRQLAGLGHCVYYGLVLPVVGTDGQRAKRCALALVGYLVITPPGVAARREATAQERIVPGVRQCTGKRTANWIAHCQRGRVIEPRVVGQLPTAVMRSATRQAVIETRIGAISIALRCGREH